MNDALIFVGNVEQLDTGLMGRAPRRDNKFATAGHQRIVAASGQRVDNMIHGAKRVPTAAHDAVVFQQTVERHTTGALV